MDGGLEIFNSLLIEGQRIAFSQIDKGYPVALLHKIPTSRLLWRHIVPALAAQGCEVTAIDLLGYGQSDAGRLGRATPSSRSLTASGWPRR